VIKALPLPLFLLFGMSVNSNVRLPAACTFSREKVRLTDEIERAEQQVLRCQEAIREAVRFCEEAQGDRAIPKEAFDSDGEVDASDIFCGRCHEMESYDDNDIVMCDGPCNRAYHEACLSPRIVAAELPEDEGWLCPACDAKVGNGVHYALQRSYAAALVIQKVSQWCMTITRCSHDYYRKLVCSWPSLSLQLVTTSAVAQLEG
jgi:hypothetical protein